MGARTKRTSPPVSRILSTPASTNMLANLKISCWLIIFVWGCKSTPSSGMQYTHLKLHLPSHQPQIWRCSAQHIDGLSNRQKANTPCTRGETRNGMSLRDRVQSCTRQDTRNEVRAVHVDYPTQPGLEVYVPCNTIPRRNHYLKCPPEWEQQYCLIQHLQN